MFASLASWVTNYTLVAANIVLVCSTTPAAKKLLLSWVVVTCTLLVAHWQKVLSAVRTFSFLELIIMILLDNPVF